MPLTLTSTLSPNDFKPISRLTDDSRLQIFRTNERAIYNKFNVYDQGDNGLLASVGPQQPFIYTKLTDSALQLNLTKYDSQALPVGSTVRDVERMGKFLLTGNGVLFLTKQLILQNQNAFNETRIYNPASVVGAAAKAGTFGITGRPLRFIRSSGGLGNFFSSALAGAAGISTRNLAADYIEGTAGSQGASPLPTYNPNGRSGVLRLPTAKAASSRFDTIWAGTSNNRSFAENLGQAIKNTVKSLIPSTNPLGILGGIIGPSSDTWRFRPEYKNGNPGIYYSFLNNQSLLGYAPRNVTVYEFYNGTRRPITKNLLVPRRDFHTYYPQEISSHTNQDDKKKWYASKALTDRELIDNTRGIVEKFNRMISIAMLETAAGANNHNASTERFTRNSKASVNDTNNYRSIGKSYYYTFFKTRKMTIEDRGFSQGVSRENPTGKPDSYNALSITKNKTDLYHQANAKDSKDIIFFYFYDLVNKVYIPFRATLNSIYDYHSPKWDDFRYMGRADSLFIYQGFSRDVSFSFKVYANSIHELIPMWERVNYMVGLTRPSKYTGKARLSKTPFQTGEKEVTTYENAVDSEGKLIITKDANGGDVIESIPVGVSVPTFGVSEKTTGLESGFIYPPMIEFRIGDMYVDQPAVIGSINVTIPEDAHWETLRSDGYQYTYGKTGAAVVGENISDTLKFASDTINASANGIGKMMAGNDNGSSGGSNAINQGGSAGDLQKFGGGGTVTMEDIKQLGNSAASATGGGGSGGKVITKNAKSRQLPTIIDVTVQLKLLEKARSITKGFHFGPDKGWKQL